VTSRPRCLLTPLIAAPLLLCAASRPAAAQGEHTQGTQQSGPSIKTHDDLQPASLPPLPHGMTVQTIVTGDAVYHGKGNCFACHGSEAEGLPAAGDALTVALNWAQYDWTSIDSLIDAGIPQVLTRSPIQMPARGGKSNLSAAEVHAVAAYIWAISQTRGEPWPGGHLNHVALVPTGSTRGTATPALVRERAPGTSRRPR
jgi:mono/diheme cytochrome c family protein